MQPAHGRGAFSGAIVALFGLFLIGLGLLTLIRPSAAERFLRSFAGSASAHYTEQGLRLLVGGAMVHFSAWMRWAETFWIFGWCLLVSTAGLLSIPWRWHHRFAAQVMPAVCRHLKMFGIGALLLGGVVLFSASHALP